MSAILSFYLTVAALLLIYGWADDVSRLMKGRKPQPIGSVFLAVLWPVMVPVLVVAYAITPKADIEAYLERKK